MSEQAKMMRVEETENPHKRKVIIEFKGSEYPVELDTTPERKKGETYEDYKERRKTVAYFLKLVKKNYVFKSLNNLEKLVGKKGLTYKNEENDNS